MAAQWRIQILALTKQGMVQCIKRLVGQLVHELYQCEQKATNREVLEIETKTCADDLLATAIAASTSYAIVLWHS